MVTISNHTPARRIAALDSDTLGWSQRRRVVKRTYGKRHLVPLLVGRKWTSFKRAALEQRKRKSSGRLSSRPLTQEYHGRRVTRASVLARAAAGEDEELVDRRSIDAQVQSPDVTDSAASPAIQEVLRWPVSLRSPQSAQGTHTSGSQGYLLPSSITRPVAPTQSTPFRAIPLVLSPLRVSTTPSTSLNAAYGLHVTSPGGLPSSGDTLLRSSPLVSSRARRIPTQHAPALQQRKPRARQFTATIDSAVSSPLSMSDLLGKSHVRKYGSLPAQKLVRIKRQWEADRPSSPSSFSDLLPDRRRSGSLRLSTLDCGNTLPHRRHRHTGHSPGDFASLLPVRPRQISIVPSRITGPRRSSLGSSPTSMSDMLSHRQSSVRGNSRVLHNQPRKTRTSSLHRQVLKSLVARRASTTKLPHKPRLQLRRSEGQSHVPGLSRGSIGRKSINNNVHEPVEDGSLELDF
ncbi:hypothetical protein PYCC9005_004477 [Savitreella phatthalungensis]